MGKSVKVHKNAEGQAMVAILMICMVLGILLGAVFTFQRGQVHLLSKGAKDYLAICAAEAGISCILAEMKANPDFVTHGSADAPEKDWSRPSGHSKYFIRSTSGLELDLPSRGAYTGRITLERTRIVAEFKTRVRRVTAKDNPLTKTIDESEKYYLFESIGKLGENCRKVSGIIEKFKPGSYILYDGQVLDTGGQGPYPKKSGILRQGRIYGHEMIMITKRGPFDSGTEFCDMEKISTPGAIRSTYDANIRFRNGKDGKIQAGFSLAMKDFNTFPEKSGEKVLGHFVLDGQRGGKSEKLPPINPLIYKESRNPAPIFLDSASQFEGFEKSLWKNPAKPTEEVYDLNFGWEFSPKKEKALFYSKVPIRIWGCPKYNAITIFCEKDVYIAGDFNANPASPQNYPDAHYIEYVDRTINGKDKVGAMVISLGRIWFDYSNPMLFLRNEFHTLLDYEIAHRFQGYSTDTQELAPSGIHAPANPIADDNKPSDGILTKKVDELLIRRHVYPFKSSADSDPRLPLTAFAFPGIAAMQAIPKSPNVATAVAGTAIKVLANLSLNPIFREIREYFTLSKDPDEYKNRFGIANLDDGLPLEKLALAATVGVVPVQVRDSVINDLLDEVTREIAENEPNPALGPWNAVDRLFKLAHFNKKSGFRLPEMTVNALLIDSAQLNAKWEEKDGGIKVENEIGNIQSSEARCFQYINSNARIPLRHQGGKIHLRTLPVKEFLDGKLRNDQFLVRRNIWDETCVSEKGEYSSILQPTGFAAANWYDISARVEEFNAFK
ncbi:MAG: hypothetical protein HQM10_15725 [Candidatus Riflebacteria bacterium]|nr:hypothetical protein [Candidatus Riflebacteria bacterium]